MSRPETDGVEVTSEGGAFPYPGGKAALEAWPEHYVDAWLDAVASHPDRAPEDVDPEVWL